jgi:hypothetical protein
MARNKPVSGASYMIKIEDETMEKLLHIVRWITPGADHEIDSNDVPTGRERDARGRLIRFILAEAAASILEEIEDRDTAKERSELVFGSRLSLTAGPSWSSLREAFQQRDDEAIDALLTKITAQVDAERRK